MKKIALTLLLLPLFSPASASAQAIGSACTVVGSLNVQPNEVLYCNGTTWAIAEEISAGGLIGIGSSATPLSSLDLSHETDAVTLPTGTTAQRPTASPGMIRYNSSTPGLEAYYSGAWQALTSGTGASTITLGTTAALTNPQRSGDATTGFYSAVASTPAVSANGIEVEQWNTIATGVDYLSVTAGKSGTAPKIAVAGTTSPQSLNFAPNGAKGVLQFNANTMFWQDNTNFNIQLGNTATVATLSQTGGGLNGQYDTALGYQALNANTTGYENLALGPLTLTSNTTGFQNVAVGEGALNVNLGGSNNTAVGVQAMVANTAGINNVAFGQSSLNHNTTGNYNTAIGTSALTANSTGVQNTAVGYLTLGNLTTGTANTAIGYGVASSMLATGSGNILIGTSSAVTTLAAGTSYNLNIGNLIQGDMTYSTALGNEALYLQSTSLSVDYLQIAGAATTTAPVVSVQGTDTNISLELLPKGTGGVGIGTASPASPLHVYSPAGTNDVLLLDQAGNNEPSLALRNSASNSTRWDIQMANSSDTPPYGLKFAYALGTTLVAISTTGSVGIGSTVPVSSLDLSQKNDAIALPTGTTAQRPTATPGMIRYNSTTPGLEAYYSGAWQALTSGTASATSTLGTTAALTNPQRSGDATTGFYSAVASTPAVSANGIEVEQWNTIATGVDYLSVTAGKSGTAPKIAVAGTTSPQSLNFAPNGAKGVLQFNGVPMFWEDATNFDLMVGQTSGSGTLSQTGGGTNGQANTALGYGALNVLTTGANNTAVGYLAGEFTTTGTSNTALGGSSLLNNTTGSFNTAVGQGVLQLNLTGTGNTGVGQAAIQNSTAGSSNTGVGAGTLLTDTTGSYNTAVGNNALYGNTTGSSNVGLGYGSLYVLTTGTNNTAIGTNVASTLLSTGSSNILIGTSAAVTTPAAGTSSSLDIGNLLQGDMTYSTALGREALYLQSTSLSVDYLQIAGGATGSPGVVTVSGQGTDTNVSIEILAKGTGKVGIGSATPTQPLDVAGNINLTGAISYTATGGIIAPDPSGNSGVYIEAGGTAAPSPSITIFPTAVYSGYSTANASINLHGDANYNSTNFGYMIFSLGAPGPTLNGGGVMTLGTYGSFPIAFQTGNATKMVLSTGGALGIGSSTPVSSLDISQETDAITLPTGTTTQRPTAVVGMIRYNSTTPGVEAYYSGAWNSLGGGTGGGTTTLGTTSATTNPQRSGDVTTGFYSAVASTVAVSANSIPVMLWNTLATGVDYLSVTPGKSGTAPKLAVTGSTTNQSLSIMPSGTGGIGINTVAPAATLDVTGQIYSRRFALTDGATIAINWANGNVQSVTMAGNRTFTFTGGVDGGRYILIIKQDTTGSRTATWPANTIVRWPGGTAPTLTTTASKTDYIAFIYNGVSSTYDGVSIAQNF